MSLLPKTKRLVARELGRASKKLSAGPSGRAVVLCYHSVHPTRPGSTPPALFAEHLRWLRSHCDIIPYHSILDAAREMRDRLVVAITFDDGYDDNYEHALPLLVGQQCTATFFLLAGVVERDPIVMAQFRSLTHDPTFQPLAWGQVNEMQAAGMEFGSHSWSHPNFARLHAAAAREELVRSKQVIEDKTGRPVIHFAYPFGKPKRHYTATTEQLVRGAGYASAAAVVHRGVRPSDSPFAIPRIFETFDGVEGLEAKVAGYRDFQGWWQENAPLWLARYVAPEDFAV